MKKKICIAIFALCMTFAWAGCGGDDSSPGGASQETGSGSSGTEEASVTSSTRLVSVENVEKYITIGEYKGMILDDTIDPVTDEDVDARVQENLRKNSSQVSQAGATVQEGDTVTINFVGTKDGVAFEGGTANNYDLVIGSGTMVPGFEDGIIGMKKGDTKEITVTFPEDYRDPDMAGTEAVFKITLQSFTRPPELNDEWAAANTDFATAEEYRDSIRTQLEEEAESQAGQSLRTTAWTTIYTNSEVKEYPEADMEQAIEGFRNQALAYAQQADMELEDFVDSQGISMEDFEEQCRQYAQAKVKQDLIIQGIMDAEGMTLDDEESTRIQEELVKQYEAGSLEGLIEAYGQVAVNESIGLLRVEDFIIANANFEQPQAEDTSADEVIIGSTEENAAGENAEESTDKDTAGENAEESTEEDAAENAEESTDKDAADENAGETAGQDTAD